MKTVAIIPARGGSKGIPGKNIIDFCGKPLLEWTINHCATAIPRKDIYVTSDDAKILAVAKDCGVRCVTRPASLSTDTASSEDAILHAIKGLPKNLTIIFPQVTSPLRYIDDIKLALAAFKKYKYDSLFSCVELTDPCIWDITKGSITYDYKNRTRRQDRKPLFLENGSIYIFKRKILDTYRNRLGGEIGMYLMEPFQAHEIDEPDDIALCEHYMRTKL